MPRMPRKNSTDRQRADKQRIKDLEWRLDLSQKAENRLQDQLGRLSDLLWELIADKAIDLVDSRIEKKMSNGW